ncbi:MAG: hypothetical protein P8R31_04160 [Mariniblastus sp.]|nr:hypothetical protein [Mariniblastus sp.]
MIQQLKMTRGVLAVIFCLAVLLGVCISIFASEPTERLLAIRTFGLGFCSFGIALPLGILTAWVCMGRGWVSTFVLLGTVASLFIPMFIHVSAWDAAFGKLGWLTSVQGQILVPLIPGWWAASWIHGIAASSQVAIIFLVGLSFGGRVFEEQALLDTSSLRVFWSVTIVRLWPLGVLAFLWVVVGCSREIAVTDLYQIGTLAEQIYLGYSLSGNSVGGAGFDGGIGGVSYGLTLGLMAVLVALSTVLFFAVTQTEYEAGGFQAVRTERSGFAKNLAGIGLIAITFLIPIGNVVLRACFYVRPVNGVPTQGYSVAQCFSAIRRACFDYQDEFIWSSIIAFASASMILVLATWISAMGRRFGWAQVLFALSLAATFALPGPLLGTAIASVTSSVDGQWLVWLFNYTVFAPVLANFIFCWPLGALVVWFVFRKIPEDALESAHVEGAGKFTQYLSLGLKANWLPLVGCWMITFACCFGELSASQIVRPAGMDTVPRKMLGDLHAGVNELTAGITIVTVLVIVGISAAGWWVVNLSHKLSERKYS